MGVDRLEAEADSLLQEMKTLPFCKLSSLVTMHFWSVPKHNPSQQISIHEGKTKGLQRQPIERALTGAIAAHEHP
jgi:hypothetical protein